MCLHSRQVCRLRKGMGIYMEKEQELVRRTDLAIEVRESFPQDSVEVSGVRLDKHSLAEGAIHITSVEIMNEHGARQMGKPMGNYITLEFEDETDVPEEEWRECLKQEIARTIQQLVKQCKKKTENCCYFVTGLGNRFATPDALGPYVVEHIEVNRHMPQGKKEEALVCAVVPGVMAQTGLESGEIISGVIDTVKPDVLIVIDALATCSIKRLCRTIQITDTGISPGAGIGNHRFQVNEETMGVPVIAIGVPTVVEANTIVLETMEEVLQREQFKEEEIQLFLQGISKQPMNNLFVTPKDVEAQIRDIGDIIAQGINYFTMELS